MMKIQGKFSFYENGALVSSYKNQILDSGFKFFIDGLLSGQGAILSRIVVGSVSGIPIPTTYTNQQGMQSQLTISIPRVGNYRLSKLADQNGLYASFEFKREVISGAGVAINEMGVICTSSNVDKLLSRRVSSDVTPLHTFSNMYDTFINWELTITVV